MQNNLKEPIPIFIDIRKAQKLFCLSRSKILKLIYDGEIIASKKCNKWLIKTESLSDFLEDDNKEINLKIKNLLSNF